MSSYTTCNKLRLPEVGLIPSPPHLHPPKGKENRERTVKGGKAYVSARLCNTIVLKNPLLGTLLNGNESRLGFTSQMARRSWQIKAEELDLGDSPGPEEPLAFKSCRWRGVDQVYLIFQELVNPSWQGNMQMSSGTPSAGGDCELTVQRRDQSSPSVPQSSWRCIPPRTDGSVDSKDFVSVPEVLYSNIWSLSRLPLCHPVCHYLENNGFCWTTFSMLRWGKFWRQWGLYNNISLLNVTESHTCKWLRLKKMLGVFYHNKNSFVWV